MGHGFKPISSATISVSCGCEKGSGIFPDNNSAKIKFLIKIDKRQVKRKAKSRKKAKSTRKGQVRKTARKAYTPKKKSKGRKKAKGRMKKR